MLALPTQVCFVAYSLLISNCSAIIWLGVLDGSVPYVQAALAPNLRDREMRTIIFAALNSAISLSVEEAIRVSSTRFSRFVV